MCFFRHPPGKKGVIPGSQFGDKYFNKWWMKACKNLGVEGLLIGIVEILYSGKPVYMTHKLGMQRNDVIIQLTGILRTYGIIAKTFEGGFEDGGHCVIPDRDPVIRMLG